MDEHYPNAYLVWSLAALSLAWALPSRAQGLLALALVFLWSWFEVFDFYQPNYWAPWLVGGGVIPLAWVLRSRVLLFFSLALFMLLYALMLMRVSDELVFGALLMSACACLAGYYLTPHTRFSGSADVFRLVGLGIYLLLLYLGSFAGLSDELFRQPTGQWQDWLFWGIPLAAALLCWAAVLIRHRACLVTGLERVEAGLIVLTLLMVATASAVFADGASWLVFNVVFLLHGAILLIQGTQGLLWKRTALGGLMLAALVFARFMDLFDSLLIRSLTFLLVGAGLFVIGHLYARRKQKLAGATPLTGAHSDGRRLGDDRMCADGGKQGDE